MASTFPATIDTIPNAPISPSLGGSTPTHSEMHDMMRDAIVALETIVKSEILTSTITYDALGRVAAANGWTYTYSSAGLLVSATNGYSTRTYSYDSVGRYTGYVVS